MKHFKLATTAGALLAATLWSSSASAAVVLANPSDFNGEEILFNDDGAITSGSQILGFTNQSETGYYFEGTTITGQGVTGNQIEATAGGQAVITADGYSNNKYPRLTSLTYYRQDGGLFNDTEFKLEDLTNFLEQQIAIQIFAWDQDGLMYDLGFVELGGDNRFAIEGTDGDSLTKVQWVATGGAVGRHKQTRVEDVIGTSAVPEPGTWGLMILGIGMVGGAMRGKRRQTVSLKYA